MGQPRWTGVLAWSVFALAVFLPLAQLALEAVVVQGRIDLSALAELLLTPGQWRLLGNSLLLAGGTTIVALAIGLPYGLLCEKTDLRGRSFFGLAYLAPLLIPPYMQAIVWSRLLAKNGPVNTTLMAAFGLSAPPFDVYSLPGAMFVLGLAYFPFVTLMVITGLKSIDSGYEEAALLQSGNWRTATRVTLPLIAPQVFAGAVFVLVFSIIDFGVPDILRVRVYPIEIFIQFSALYDERAAVVLSIPLLLITVALISLQVWAMRGHSYISFGHRYRSAWRYRLGSAQTGAMAFCAAVLVFAVLIPVGALVESSESIAIYRKVLGSSLDQIGLSFLIAAGAAGVMTVLAFIVAHGMISSSGRVRTLLEYVTQLPFAVPPIVLGIGLIKVWDRPMTEWVYGTALIIVLGYLAHFIPFTIRAVYASLQQLNPRLEEAGWLMTKSRYRVTWRIVLPRIRNGLITGFFISFVLAMGDLGVTLLVIPPGTATIPITIYNYMHYGAQATVAALCVILLVLQLALSVGLFGLSRWRRATV